VRARLVAETMGRWGAHGALPQGACYGIASAVVSGFGSVTAITGTLLLLPW